MEATKLTARCRTYYGTEAEDSTNFWMVVGTFTSSGIRSPNHLFTHTHTYAVWESHAHHQAMMDRPDYPAMVGRLKPYLRTEQLYMRHVQFNSTHFNDSYLNNNGLLTAFDAPVSAILFVTPRKDGDDVQKGASVAEVLEGWAKATDSAKNNNEHPPAVWGAAEEDANETLLVIGWKGVEVCFP